MKGSVGYQVSFGIAGMIWCFIPLYVPYKLFVNRKDTIEKQIKIPLTLCYYTDIPESPGFVLKRNFIYFFSYFLSKNFLQIRELLSLFPFELSQSSRRWVFLMSYVERREFSVSS